jgi:predicted nucleic acid-binding protein
MFLLDTVVLSETTKRRPNQSVIAWLSGKRDEALFVSVLSLGEVEAGIERTRRSDPAFATALEAWLQSTQAQFAGRILPFDLQAALIWGRLTVQVGYSGVDTQLAATALQHDLTVVTRNARHFVETGVRVVNPFAG